MAIRLEIKTRVEAPSADYPYGRILDKTDPGGGTPVNKEVYGDFHQFFAKLLADASIVGNDLPENNPNTFQYILALNAKINALGAILVAAEASLRSSADTTLNNSKVDRAGDTMSGNLSMGGGKVINLAAASGNGEAVRYEELQSEASTRSSADTTLQNNINAINAILLRKVIDIGDFNMNNISVTVAHGLTLSKIRGIKVLVRDDSDNIYQPLGVDYMTYGGYRVVGADVQIFSGVGSVFATTDYDSLSYNRGWIIIDYAP